VTQRKSQIARRSFLKGAACAVGGLAVPFGLGSIVRAAAPPAGNTFRMVSFGDSAMWGQGLPEAQKYRTLVKNWLATQFQGQRNVIELPTHAHSGAVTGFGAWPKGVTMDPDLYYQDAKKFPGYPYPGEVPASYPSISYQMKMTLADLQAQGLGKGDVDLVLINGGINDIGVVNVLTIDPSVGLLDGSEWVKKQTRNVMLKHMSSLLPSVLNSFPNAKVVITGYFPIVSHDSDLAAVAAFITALGAAAGAAIGSATTVAGTPTAGISAGLPVAGTVAVVATPALKARLAAQSKAFNDEALAGLNDLVATTNRSLGTPRVGLAWPDFQPQNSYAAGDTYLFKVGQFVASENRGREREQPAGDWSTSDGVAYYRAQSCSMFGSNIGCYDASMGHPNAKGAWAYANAITALLPGLGVVPHAATPVRNMTLTVQGGKISSLNYWVNVTALDSATHAPVHGTVSINGVIGATGNKIVFNQCSHTEIDGVGGSKHKVTEAGPCQGTVTAPGYAPIHFSGPS